MAKKPTVKTAVVLDDATSIKTTDSKIKEESTIRNKNTTEIPRDYEIPVKSNVIGELVYKSRNGYYEWGELGDIEYITFGELITMRNTHRKYYESNWIVFEDSDYTADEVYKALNVEQLYSITKLYGSIEDIFNMPFNELSKLVPTLPSGLRNNIIAFVKDAYNTNNKKLDSRSAVKAFEEAFDIKLGID